MGRTLLKSGGKRGAQTKDSIAITKHDGSECDDAELACEYVHNASLNLPWIQRAYGEITRAAETLTASAQSEGSPILLEAIRLSQLGMRRNNPHPYFNVNLNVIDAKLAPETINLCVDSTEELEFRFAQTLEMLEPRYAAKKDLQAKQASGKIDALALNMIQLSGDWTNALIKLQTRDRLILPSDVFIEWQDGELVSFTDRFGQKLHWGGNELTVMDIELPESILSAAIGQPITTIMDPPGFSNEMIIKKIDQNNAGSPDLCVNISLHMPKYYFTINRNLDTPVVITPC